MTEYSSEVVHGEVLRNRPDNRPQVYYLNWAPVQPGTVRLSLAVPEPEHGRSDARLLQGHDLSGSIQFQTLSHTIRPCGEIDYAAGRIEFDQDWPYAGREFLVTYRYDTGICVVDRLATLEER